MPVAIASVPSLSELLAWPTEHLTEAAVHWTATGERWYEVFTQIRQDSLSVDWKGNGADALRNRTYADEVRVSGLVDQLHEAAKVARACASDLYAARSRVRYAVEDAGHAGFVVGEDLSVSDRSTGRSAATRAGRQAQAQAFAGDIRQRAAQLVGLDQQVAGKITNAMAGIDTLRFDEAPVIGDNVVDDDKRHQVHAVDHQWKKDPSPIPGPPNGANDIKKALEGIRDGKSRGVKEVDTEKEIFELWGQLSKGGRRLPVPDNYYDRVQLPDGTIIGVRESDGYGPTVDVKYPPGITGPTKVHLPPPLSQAPVIAAPNLPSALAHPPVTVPPAEGNHPAISLPPTVLDHPPLPPWLQNPSPPGYQVAPSEPPPFAPVDIPDAPTAPAPPAAHGPPITLHMPELQPPTPAQERGFLGTLGAIVVGGLAVLGGLGEGLEE